MTKMRAAAEQALAALEVVTRHFTRAPSTFNDSEARGTAHTAMHALRAALAAAPAPAVPATAVTKEALIDLIISHLTGTYHCTRVWEAWGVGTMTEDDFEPASESDMPVELADALLSLLGEATSPAQPSAEPLAKSSERQPFGDLRNAKWLDPECYTSGACQSLKFKAAQPSAEPAPPEDMAVYDAIAANYRAQPSAEPPEWVQRVCRYISDTLAAGTANERTVARTIMHMLPLDALCRAPSAQPAAQPSAEPVAWIDSKGHPHHKSTIQSGTHLRLYGPLKPLYLAQPAAQPLKPLTDDALIDGFTGARHSQQYVSVFIAGARFAERAHGIDAAVAQKGDA